MMSDSFDSVFRNKKVLITGHTGFKGSWLTVWLSELGAAIYGYALDPPSVPSMFDILDLKRLIDHEQADVRDVDRLKKTIREVRPDIIFHLAAQSLVGESYLRPLETIQVNTLGSLNVLEAVRQCRLPVVVIMVTSDKCYDNKEWVHGYRETDRMGGYDPYSVSKGTTELLIDSWRRSFFPVTEIKQHGVRLASVRAGNVIGGGDWGKDRIVPDCIRSLEANQPIAVRMPEATRPWQHVLEPLHGYMHLAATLAKATGTDAAEFCEAFNFGPHINSNKTVGELVDKIIQHWGRGKWHAIKPVHDHHEASLLNLSIDKAFHKLKWKSRWDFDTTVRNTIDWYVWKEGDPSGLLDFTIRQIQLYERCETPLEKSVEEVHHNI